MMKRQMQIEKYFEEFLEGSKKYQFIKIKLPKRKLELEYYTHFIDEWDSTGWIYYKPIGAKSARFYMFKGKPVKLKPYKKCGFLRVIKKLKTDFKDFRYKGDWKMRNKAELQIAKPFILLILLGLTVGAIVLGPKIMVKVGWIAEKSISVDVGDESSINEDIIEETDEVQTNQKDE